MTAATRPGPGTTSAAVRWNSLAVVGKQFFMFGVSIVLARLLGPETYGVVSAAMIYVTFTMLLLDQGLAAALVQRPELSRWAPGVVATANLVSAVLLGVVTWLVAPFVADFFHDDRLAPVLQMLGAALWLKALAIVPRAMQQRALTFRAIAMADVVGAFVGAAAGVAAALLGAGPAAVVAMVVATDVVVAAVLLRAERGPAPNLHLRELRELLPFGARVMATNGIAYFSRNVDNILVGRVLGLASLSFYGMAYRVLVIPVQLIAQTVSRVMFPVFSRLADRRDLLAENLVRTTQLLALLAVPLMGLAAVGAHELVDVVLGEEWLPSASLLTVLAVAGARETVLYVTSPLMKATGEVKLLLRYELLATVLQVGGIVVGLLGGTLGVAVGYTVAGFVLTPVLLLVQRRLTGLTGGQQARAILPPVHAALWGAAAYVLVARLLDGSLLVLAVGAAAYLAVAAGVLLGIHRRSTVEGVARLRRLATGKA
ncbi:polysaccharide biosynthesis protein [Cellulomonas flavigena DSM 20109]|uniref:Polysaccharide biosynthesis protein n=1 Tax=Cellulomonas flavigena (strain ATCC 482 / DSM 20109 / BCRC 11376 / JCM 18109 / NBRC 3775 / NCIMB 8073 / NRS 134) TaxID=446466 RepID=D5UK59_CELFN|nr:lipopolysaccharide biosynthesis protein [Cellulomonas flavigena]ADG73801.1 polysaccharide biosynthesis protein [Cellulomonas flavigena DSM 20109]